VIAHGHVVIDGSVDIGRDCLINPWVTIGLSGSRRWGFDARGPVIGDRVYIGTGAKILGPITIGDDVRIGANAVVIDDVPGGATVVGAPARVVHSAPPRWLSSEEAER
jgi:serine O-acetyltransferase